MARRHCVWGVLNEPGTVGSHSGANRGRNRAFLRSDALRPDPAPATRSVANNGCGPMRVTKRSAAPPLTRRRSCGAEAQSGRNILSVANLRETLSLNGWRSSDRDAVAENSDGVPHSQLAGGSTISLSYQRAAASRQKRSVRLSWCTHSGELPFVWHYSHERSLVSVSLTNDRVQCTDVVHRPIAVEECATADRLSRHRRSGVQSPRLDRYGVWYRLARPAPRRSRHKSWP